EYLATTSVARDLTSRDRQRHMQAWDLLWPKRLLNSWAGVTHFLIGAFAQQRTYQGVQSALEWVRELDEARSASDPGDCQLALEIHCLTDALEWTEFRQSPEVPELVARVVHDWTANFLQAARQRHTRRLERLLAMTGDLRRWRDSGLDYPFEQFAAAL